MPSIYTLRSLKVLFLLFMIGCICGCAGSAKQIQKAAKPSRIVQTDDLVSVDYTCRLSDGKIVATTLETVAADDGMEKSHLFRSSGQRFAPFLMRAGGQPEGVAAGDRDKNMQEHIAMHLVNQVVGLRTGASATMELTAELIPGLSPDDRYLRLARVWRYAKTETIARQEYENVMQAIPEVGYEFPWRGPFTARVEEVSEHFVRLAILASPEAVMTSPFGSGPIRDGGEWWEVKVDASEGDLVMSAGLMGRISEVDEKMITADFGYPFAEETLTCDVIVNDVDEKSSSATTVATAKKPEGTGRQEMAAAGASAAVLASRDNSSPTHQEHDLHVDFDDLVEAHFTATLEDGSIVKTTRAEVWNDPDLPKMANIDPPKSFGPVEFVAGEHTVFPELGTAVLDMQPGQKKQLAVVPGNAFGDRDLNKVETFPSVRRIPERAVVKADTYLKQFKVFPVEGKEIQFTPYFKSRIVKVDEDEVILEALAVDGTRVESEFDAVTEIRIEGDEVVLQLIPEVGSVFRAKDRTGIVSAFDEETFTVDFNHPLAGKPLLLEVELLSVTKADRYAGKSMPWIEDHDAGLAAAEAQHKPAVMVLYADWCSFCKKLFNETLDDIRVKKLQDEFVWIKVNSDKQEEFKLLYEQKGFPLVVLMDAHGEVIDKIDGFRPANVFRDNLQRVLEADGVKADHNKSEGNKGSGA